HVELWQTCLRALRDRIEGAKRLDLITEQLDPRGLFRGSRVDVDDAAAARERTRLAHLRHRFVAKVEEPRGGLLPRELVARAKGPATPREVVRTNGVLEAPKQG